PYTYFWIIAHIAYLSILFFKCLYNVVQRYSKYLFRDTLKPRFIAGEMKHTMGVAQRFLRSEERCRRDAFNLVKRSHLAAVGQRSVVISVYSVTAERVFFRRPFLVQVSRSGVYVKLHDGQHPVIGV